MPNATEAVRQYVTQTAHSAATKTRCGRSTKEGTETQIEQGLCEGNKLLSVEENESTVKKKQTLGEVPSPTAHSLFPTQE